MCPLGLSFLSYLPVCITQSVFFFSSIIAPSLSVFPYHIRTPPLFVLPLLKNLFFGLCYKYYPLFLCWCCLNIPCGLPTNPRGFFLFENRFPKGFLRGEKILVVWWAPPQKFLLSRQNSPYHRGVATNVPNC